MLMRHTLAYGPAQLLSPLLQLGAALLLTYALGAADYGLTMLIFASQELVFLVCLSWWTTFYMRYGGRWVGADSARTTPPTLAITASGPGSAPAQAQALAGIEAAIVLSSSLAQVLITVLVIVLTNPALPGVFYLAACAFTVSRSALGFLSERARREAHIRSYSAVQVAAPLGGLVLTWVLIAHDAATPARVLGLFAASQAAVGIVVAARLRLLVWPQRPPRALLRAALDFGAPVLVSNLLSWLAGNSIRFVVHHGAGAVALGLLSVGWGLATRLAGVAAMLVAAAAYPLAVKAMEAGDVQGAKRQLSDNSVLLLALLAPTAAAMVVLSEPLTRLLVAPEYQAMTRDVLPWALAGACIRNLRMHGWDQLYLLCEAPRAMVVLDAIEATAMTAAALAGLWLGGVKGAVVATTLASIAVALGDWAYLRRRFALQAPFWRYARVLGAAGVMGAALQGAAWLGWSARPQVLDITGAALLATAVYGAMLVAFFPGPTGRVLAWWQRRRAAA